MQNARPVKARRHAATPRGRHRCAGPKWVYLWYMTPIVTTRTTLRRYLHVLILDTTPSV